MDQTETWEAAEAAATRLQPQESRRQRAVRQIDAKQLQGLEKFNVYFDGCNNPEPYGSWEVCYRGFKKRAERLKFTCLATNNSAEWSALISALEWLQSVSRKEFYCVNIHGDSQLALYQLIGKYRCKKEHLKPLLARALELLSGFGWWTTNWQPRRHSVARFGH